MFRKIIIDSRHRSSGTSSIGIIPFGEVLTGDFIIEKFMMKFNIDNISFSSSTVFFTVNETTPFVRSFNITVENGFYEPTDLDIYLSNLMTAGSLSSGNSQTYIVTYDDKTGKFVFNSNSQFSITYGLRTYPFLGFNKPPISTTTTSLSTSITSDNPVNLNEYIQFCFLDIINSEPKNNSYLSTPRIHTSFAIPIENPQLNTLITYSNDSNNIFIITFNNKSTLSYRFHNVFNEDLDAKVEWRMVIHKLHSTFGTLDKKVQ